MSTCKWCCYWEARISPWMCSYTYHGVALITSSWSYEQPHHVNSLAAFPNMYVMLYSNGYLIMIGHTLMTLHMLLSDASICIHTKRSYSGLIWTYYRMSGMCACLCWNIVNICNHGNMQLYLTLFTSHNIYIKQIKDLIKQ